MFDTFYKTEPVIINYRIVSRVRPDVGVSSNNKRMQVCYAGGVRGLSAIGDSGGV